MSSGTRIEEQYLNEFSLHFSKEILPDIFSSSPDAFKKSSVSIDLSDSKIVVVPDPIV